MKCRIFEMCLLLFSLGLSWGQVSESDSMPEILPTSSLNEMDSSLLWKIGSESMESSIASFEKLGSWMTSVESWMKKSLELSEKVLELSVQQERIMNEVLPNLSSLKTSLKSYEKNLTFLVSEIKKIKSEVMIWQAFSFIELGIIAYISIKQIFNF